MKSGARVSLTLGVLIAVLFISVALSKADDDSSNCPIESGQPRDLINQPVCWPPDRSHEARHSCLAAAPTAVI